MSGGTSMLREVLARVRTAPPGTGLDDIARGAGLTRDEVNAMIEYWVRRGELVVDELGSCSRDCGGCRFGSARGGCRSGSARGGGYRPAPRSGPVLVAIRAARDPVADRTRSGSTDELTRLAATP